jgi:battenin
VGSHSGYHISSLLLSRPKPNPSSSVNVFYRINHEPPDANIRYNDIELTRQAREFRIGSIGFADSTGILLASILAVPTEVELCKAQVARGKLFCKGL